MSFIGPPPGGGDIAFDDLARKLEWRVAGQRRATLSGDLLRFEMASNVKTVDIAGNTIGTLDLFGPPSNSQVHGVANSAGTARLQLSSSQVSNAVNIEADAGSGGCGIIELRDSNGNITITLDGCTGIIGLRNSAGQTTVEFDAQTGDVRYTGSLVKR
jgi:hypothetical protein